jgi:predicted Rossmann fold flavoprotein
MMDWDAIIIGAGPSGLLAACRVAERGRRTLLLEKNRRPGVKILLSGGTRCNLTHATDRRGIVEAFGVSGRFLHSALSVLGPQELVDLFASEGVRTKIEPETDKIFPASDKALDVLEALLARLKRSGCVLACEEPLEDLRRLEIGFQLTTPRRTLTAEKVLLATGGKSYPGCGTTGDGYRWSTALGHTIVPPRPALVPLRTDARWVPPLQGLTIPDVQVTIVDSREPGASANHGQAKRSARSPILASRRGSFLFTHFGLSGPVVLDVSRAVSGHPHPETLQVVCDFLPQMRQEDLDIQLTQQGATSGKRQMANVVAQWLPHRLVEAIAQLADVTADRRMAELGKAERVRLLQAIKQLPIPISGTLGFKKAEVTAGGVALDEVDSRTMQSRLVPGLFFAGELLDLDGFIGGYNFQAAFSTGYLAGENL